MENKLASVLKRENRLDSVTTQNILREQIRKEEIAASEWESNWGFLKNRHFYKQAAKELGISTEDLEKLEFRKSKSFEGSDELKKFFNLTEITPPKKTSGLIGLRGNATLEKFGRLVKTQRDYSINLLPPKGQIYDPYKQTILYIGNPGENPVHMKISPELPELSEELLHREIVPEVSQFDALHYKSHANNKTSPNKTKYTEKRST